MRRLWTGMLYETAIEQNDEEGWISLDLFAVKGAEKTLAARVCYWDALGQFMIQTFDRDVPLTIVEDLIAEAKEEIKL